MENVQTSNAFFSHSEENIITGVVAAATRSDLAKSSTSNRLQRIAYRELVLERLRLVPKGHWTLAGGANHRFVVKIESEPRPGLRKSRDDHSVAPAGARRISWSEPVVCSRRGDLISATPPAFVIDAVPQAPI